MPGQDEPRWGTMPSKRNLMPPFGKVPHLHERHDYGPNINIAPGVPHYAPITAKPLSMRGASIGRGKWTHVLPTEALDDNISAAATSSSAVRAQISKHQRQPQCNHFTVIRVLFWRNDRTGADRLEQH